VSGHLLSRNKKMEFSFLDIYREVSRVAIFCNDCRSTSRAFFHFIGLECRVCGSFNTVRK
jgi:hypothetical protein